MATAAQPPAPTPQHAKSERAGDPGRVEPRRELGRWGLTAVGISAIVGGGIYGLPAAVAAATGAAGLVAYLSAAAATLLFGLAMGRLSRHHDLSGGPYVYVGAAFGRFWGFQAGWFFFLARVTALAAVSEVFILYLGALWAPLGAGAGRAAAMSVCLGALALLNIVGIREASRAMNAFAVGKLLPLALFILAGAIFVALGPAGGAWARLTPTEIPPLPAFGHTVLLLVYAFGGFEFLTVPAEEAHRPREHTTFALLASIGAVSVLYVGVQAMAMASTPDLARRTAPLADAAQVIVGRPGFLFMAAGALVATVGTLLATILVASRMIYAFSRDGLVPAWPGALHPRFRTPVRAILLFTLAGLVLAISGTFARMAALTAAARLVVYGACCAAAAKESRLLPAIGLAAALLLIGMLPPRDWLVAGGAVALGLGIYFVGRKKVAPASCRQGPNGDGFSSGNVPEENRSDSH